MEPINFDLAADLYDSYVTTALDVPFFLDEAGRAGGEILELMCGTGRVSIPLIEKGFKLTCVDKSVGMLDIFSEKLKAKNLFADIIRADVCELKLNKIFDLIFIPFHSFSEILTRDGQLHALKRIYEHLHDSGTFICTLQNPKIRLKTADGQLRFLGRFPLNAERKLVVSYANSFDASSGVVSGCQFYEIFGAGNRLIEKRLLDINFRPVELRDFESMAAEAGFAVDIIYGDYGYSDFDDEKSAFMICILRKGAL